MDNQYQPVTPEERDNMPADVALEMLTNPKNKLSARMRKNCFAAREKVFVSKHPVRWVSVKDNESNIGIKWALCWDTDVTARPWKDRITLRLGQSPWQRLNRMVKRMDKRIARVEGALARAEKVIKIPWILEKMRTEFGNRVETMQTVRQLAESEIAQRKASWKTNQ